MAKTLDALIKDYGTLTGKELLAAFMAECKSEIVLLSAFNPEDVILAKWAAEINPSLPILFLDTKKHFPETLRYVADIKKQLGLKDVRVLEPRDDLVANIDAKGELWQTQVNRCCWLRKVEPIEREIERAGFKTLITGRRIEQTPERHDMRSIEQDEKGHIKINPLKDWTLKERDDYMEKEGLPHHPLYALGYLSIGCAPCTTPIFPGEDERMGRWRHTKLNHDGDGKKNECGLHVAINHEEE